ncbi:hypothetical protein WMR86_04155 [Proteus vulgaris]
MLYAVFILWRRGCAVVLWRYSNTRNALRCFYSLASWLCSSATALEQCS